MRKTTLAIAVLGFIAGTANPANLRSYESTPHLTKVAQTPEAKAVCENPAYTRIDLSNRRVRELIDEGTIDQEFIQDLEMMCSELDMNCMGMLSVMDYETDGSFDPRIRNHGSVQPNGDCAGCREENS